MPSSVVLCWPQGHTESIILTGWPPPSPLPQKLLCCSAVLGRKPRPCGAPGLFRALEVCWGWGAWCGLWPSAGQPRSSVFLRSLPRGPSEAGASRDLGPGPKPMTLPYPDSLGGTWASPDPGGWEVYLPYHLDERQSHVVGCGCWGLRRRLPVHRQPCPTPRWGI